MKVWHRVGGSEGNLDAASLIKGARSGTRGQTVWTVNTGHST